MGNKYDLIGYQFLHDKRVVTVTLSYGLGKVGEHEKTYDQVAASLRFRA